jgi:hypothetical protein
MPDKARPFVRRLRKATDLRAWQDSRAAEGLKPLVTSAIIF